MIVIPGVYEAVDERAEYLATHYWNAYLDTATVHFTDSTHFNGVGADPLEQAMGLFVTLLDQVPLSQGAKAMDIFHGKAAAFPEPRVYEELCRLTEKYLYNPSSPVRSEELYLPFVTARVDSGHGTASDRFAKRICSLNRLGTPAADFDFIDTKGRRRTLYGIPAERMILIFGNPDCEACRELSEILGSEPGISAAIAAGKLKVVDVYIDEDIAGWKAAASTYPSEWICGYDPSGVIRSDVLYGVRAIPSIYLLDSGKKVLLKDVETQKLLENL